MALCQATCGQGPKGHQFMLEVIQSLELEVGDRELAFSVQALRELCQRAGWGVPELLSLKAAMSPAVLVHWRSMSTLIGLFMESKRCLFLTSGRRQSGSPMGCPASSLIGGVPHKDKEHVYMLYSNLKTFN